MQTLAIASIATKKRRNRALAVVCIPVNELCAKFQIIMNNNSIKMRLNQNESRKEEKHIEILTHTQLHRECSRFA